jgi:UDP-N-acetylmuramate--alanine ligase
VGSAGVVRLLERLSDWDGRIVRVRLAQDDEGAEESDPGAAQIAGRLLDRPDRSATLVIRGLEPGTMVSARLPLVGRHNAENALAVAAAAHELGVSGPAIRAGLESFPGVGRRMELKGEIGGVVVVDDYAHHPTAIAATIAAVRSRYPGRRLWAVYEPLTYHRTAALLDGFSRVLATADRVLIADIWAGRDPDTTITSASALATAVASSGLPSAAASGPVEQTADILAAEVEPGDIVLVMGGGRSYVVADRLVHLLRLRTGGRTGAG